VQKKQQPSVLEIVGAVLAMFGFFHITGVLGRPGGPATLAFDVLGIVVGAALVAVGRARRAKKPPAGRPNRSRRAF
jgi:hypothetical protein